MTDLVIWGAGGHALVLHEFLAPAGYRLVAVFDNDPAVANPFPGVPLHAGEAGFAAWRAAHPDGGISGVVAIGGGGGPARHEIQRLLEQGGIAALTAVHPAAWVAADATLGRGCHVLAQSAVGTRATIGDACIVNTGAGVDHECVLETGVHIGPGAVLAGRVTVGAFAFVGAGAVVLPRIRIGARAIVGAGAVVTRDVPAATVVAGNPARTVRPVRDTGGSLS